MRRLWRLVCSVRKSRNPSQLYEDHSLTATVVYSSDSLWSAPAGMMWLIFSADKPTPSCNSGSSKRIQHFLGMYFKALTQIKIKTSCWFLYSISWICIYSKYLTVSVLLLVEAVNELKSFPFKPSLLEMFYILSHFSTLLFGCLAL